METDHLSVVDFAEKKQVKVHLEDISEVLIETLKIKKKIKSLTNLFNRNINELHLISKDIKAEAVTKTRFNRKVMRLMRRAQIQNTQDKFQFKQNKKKFSDILKNMGKNMMREIFLVDKVDTLTKSDFRRYIENKVKSYLNVDFVDFDNIAQIHLFEKMKKKINFELNIKKGIITYEDEVPVNMMEKKYNAMKIDNMIIGNNLSSIKRRNKPHYCIKQSKQSEFTRNVINNGDDSESNCEDIIKQREMIDSEHMDGAKIKIAKFIETYRSCLDKIEKDKIKLISHEVNEEISKRAIDVNKPYNILEIVKEKLIFYSNLNKQTNKVIIDKEEYNNYNFNQNTKDTKDTKDMTYNKAKYIKINNLNDDFEMIDCQNSKNENDNYGNLNHDLKEQVRAREDNYSDNDSRESCIIVDEPQEIIKMQINESDTINGRNQSDMKKIIQIDMKMTNRPINILL